MQEHCFSAIRRYCWSMLENPDSPYEMARFTIQQEDEIGKTYLNSFVAVRKENPSVKGWHRCFSRGMEGGF